MRAAAGDRVWPTPWKRLLIAALAVAPEAVAASSLEALLDVELDGLVIATPSALHAMQATAALERGSRCSARNRWPARLARRLPSSLGARRRPTAAASTSRTDTRARCVAFASSSASGDLGEIYAVDLVFHNAYGPDKAWFRDPRAVRRRLRHRSRHPSRRPCAVDARLSARRASCRAVSTRKDGRWRRPLPWSKITPSHNSTLDTGAVVRLACSWNLAAGCDAVIEATFSRHARRRLVAQRERLVLRLRGGALRRHAPHARSPSRRTPGAAVPPSLGAAARRSTAASTPRSSARSKWPQCWMRSMAAETPPRVLMTDRHGRRRLALCGGACRSARRAWRACGAGDDGRPTHASAARADRGAFRA